MVTEPWLSQVAWSQSMSWCRALLIVPHVLRWVVSSGLGHALWMRGILAFARADLMMFGGRMPWAPVAFLPTVRCLDGAHASHASHGCCQDVSGPEMGAGGSPYRAQVYTVYAVP